MHLGKQVILEKNKRTIYFRLFELIFLFSFDETGNFMSKFLFGFHLPFTVSFVMSSASGSQRWSYDQHGTSNRGQSHARSASPFYARQQLMSGSERVLQRSRSMNNFTFTQQQQQVTGIYK